MDADQAQVVEVIDGLLRALIDAVPASERPALEERTRVIGSLLVQGGAFSVEGFISGEVARALAD